MRVRPSSPMNRPTPPLRSAQAPAGTPPPPVPPPPPPPSAPSRLRRGGGLGFTRSRTDRVIAGVAGGLGHKLGVDPVLVRIVFAVLAFAGGSGIVVYGVAWLLTPVDDEHAAGAGRPATIQQGVALFLIMLGVLLFLRRTGLWFGDNLVFPIVLAATGSAVVWARGDEQSRARFSRITRRLPGGGAVAAAAAGPVSPVRVVVGTLLVAGAIAGFLASHEAAPALRDIGIALVAAVGGIALLFGPWLWRLIEQLGTERRERIRQEERAELAAHLHDSVLQTLTLIQRSADQPRRMVALARRQERELRSWLYGSSGDPGSPTTLVDATEAVAEEVEATHDINVEVVVVGDAPLDDQVRALLAAAREACVNAAKHAGVDAVDVYVEVEDDAVTAFVRDRGVGFDPTSVPGDRQGIRRSIVQRLERNGGHASVWSEQGGGTEIELSVPRPRRPANGDSSPYPATDPPADPAAASYPAPPSDDPEATS